MSSISFTGHRKLSEDTAVLSQRLYKKLEEEINKGITDFNAGGAIGFDCISAAVVLKLRDVYPHIKLNLILPCSNKEQTIKWSDDEKAEFYRILKLADSVEYTSEHYYDGCMKKRNARLVELQELATVGNTCLYLRSVLIQLAYYRIQSGGFFIPVINW